MSTQQIPTTQDPSKYWRTGVAITLSNKAIFEARLKSLNLKSMGDLVTAFILAPGMVDALQPVVEKYHSENIKAMSKGAAKAKTKEVANKLQGLTPEQLEKLLELAKAA